MSIAKRYRPYYTYEDYCQWEGRWELIEGMPYAMSPLPVPQHQRVCLKLCMLLEEAVEDCKQCKVYPPLDWKIAEDTIVQPDVLIVCKNIEKKFLDFAPVLVVEVLSPATASKDRNEKKELYQSQKVEYYIIVDAQFKKLEVYELHYEKYRTVPITRDGFEFAFDDCSIRINFNDIWD